MDYTTINFVIYNSICQSSFIFIVLIVFLFCRTNLPKQVMEYPDFPFPKESKTFLTHKEVLDYLKDYCDNFGLADVIQFNTRVKKVIPLLESNDTKSDGLNVRWRITAVNQRSEETSSDFDSVVVCNG